MPHQPKGSIHLDADTSAVAEGPRLSIHTVDRTWVLLADKGPVGTQQVLYNPPFGLY